jgi:hypothetical protein
MGLRFATRDGSITPEEGLRTAYELFRDGRPKEAAMMFLVYADPDDIGVVGESEYTALAEHLTEVMAHVAVFNMICEEQIQPVLDDNGEPAYKTSPWADEDYSPS